MIEIRFTPPNELDVAGLPDELEAIRRRVLDLVEACTDEVAVEADAAIDPTPYESSLAKMTIAEGRGPVKVTVCGEMGVRVEGSREALEAFASYLHFEPDAREGAHAHYEYHDGNDLIDPESVPLVISVKQPSYPRRKTPSIFGSCSHYDKSFGRCNTETARARRGARAFRAGVGAGLGFT